MVLTYNTFTLLVLLGLAIAIPGAILVLSAIAGRPKHRTTDVTPYECGSRLFESARHPFTVKFYLIAMLFILFDIEAVFLFPWAVELKDQVGTTGAWFVLIEMLVFIAILAAGFAYAWGRGALDWDR
ncbi:MAG: NADH-quinone oxidoreductase subunit A [Acidobacteria bacterium]|jgi:NADH-quinone oxidoreductase subunit A|nr:NADH-quinone oxidoreductase subunit A [Acidobacteriota bacterium]